jgi:hypothetical protein
MTFDLDSRQKGVIRLFSLDDDVVDLLQLDVQE